MSHSARHSARYEYFRQSRVTPGQDSPSRPLSHEAELRSAIGINLLLVAERDRL